MREAESSRRERGPMKLITTCSLAIMMCLSPLYAQRRMARATQPVIRRVQYGIASWYGREDQGRLMACGVPFNEYAMVAAHRTLPLGTRVRVTNLRNGRSVVVRISDRGPGVRGRIIDVSKAAARRLGFTHRGLAPVKVRVLSVPSRKPHYAQTNSSLAEGG